MKRTVLFIAMAACILSSCGKQPGGVQNPEAGGTLRVLYWNIQNGMWADQENNYENFVKFVRRIDPDVCIWVESGTIYKNGTNTTASMKYLPDHWEDVAARYGHGNVMTTYMKGNYPQTVTSKYPVTKVKDLVGDASVSMTHTCGHFRMVWNGQNLNIVTVHLYPQADGDAKRESEIRFVCENTIARSAKARDEYWLMAGDFNSRSQADDFYYGLGASDSKYAPHRYVAAYTPYSDVFAVTYPGQFKPTMYHGNTRLDYIYCTPPLLSVLARAEFATLDEWGGKVTAHTATGFKIPSDHYPMIIEFKINE